MGRVNIRMMTSVYIPDETNPENTKGVCVGWVGRDHAVYANVPNVPKGCLVAAKIGELRYPEDCCDGFSIKWLMEPESEEDEVYTDCRLETEPFPLPESEVKLVEE